MVQRACVLVVVAMSMVGCESYRCGYGGAGCGDPIVAGLCEDNILVIGDRYHLIFGYGSDTGVSEAVITGADTRPPELLEVEVTVGSSDAPETLDGSPFDLNNGPGDGGLILSPIGPGVSTLLVDLDGWDDVNELDFEIVEPEDAPPGFVSMTEEERLVACVGETLP